MLQCATLGDPMDPSPPGCSVHGILQARILERVAMFSLQGIIWIQEFKTVPPTAFALQGDSLLLSHRGSGNSLGFPGGSAVKNPLAMQETWVLPLGLEDPLEKEMATHSSILAWEIPWTEEPGGLQSVGLQNRHDWATKEHQRLISCYLKKKNHTCSLSRKAPVKKPNSVALCYDKETSGPGSCLNKGAVRRPLMEREVVAWVLKLIYSSVSSLNVSLHFGNILLRRGWFPEGQLGVPG